jgi:hypothetical protein
MSDSRITLVQKMFPRKHFSKLREECSLVDATNRATGAGFHVDERGGSSGELNNVLLDSGTRLGSYEVAEAISEISPDGQ